MENQEEKPKKKFYKRWWVWALAAVVLLIIIVSASGKQSTTQSVPAASDNTGTAQTQKNSAPAPAPTQQSAPQVLLNVSGSGTKTTQKFTAASDWDLNWSYDCSSFGDQGNFQVMAYNGDGSLSYGITPVNQLGKSGADVEHYHTGGTYYLTVNSECKWSIQVKG